MGLLRTQSRVLYARLKPALVLAGLIALALSERVSSTWRRLRRLRPRLVWGPVPIISLKYWSEAMKRRGFQSLTCVTAQYAINKREDFDVYRDEFGSDYRFFAWALRRGDVFIRFLDGGYLRPTPLRWWELRLLRLAGKKVVVIPYGSDIAVDGYLNGLEEPLFTDYPSLRDASAETKRWVDHTAERADVVVHHHQPGYMPRYDAILPNHFAIDTSQWHGEPSRSEADGKRGTVTVMHAPNHRNIKGTVHLEGAIEALRADGVKVELKVIEGMPNQQIRTAMAESDILADQFLSPGYAMFSIEGMAAARPVLNNLRTLPDELLRTEVLRDCPVVDTDPERLRADLRRLIEDPELRRELGRRGRRYVERYHSYEGLGTELEAIISHAWLGTPLPERLLPAARRR